MSLQDPYVPTPADHLGNVTLTLVDVDGVEANITVRADIRLMDAEWNQVAVRTGLPDFMPADWQTRAIVLIQELRAATAVVQEVDPAPPPVDEE